MKYKTKLLVASAVLIGSLCFGKVLYSKLSSKVDNIREEISTPIEHITSSLQHKEPGKALAETLMEESQAGNYVAITSSFIMNPLNRDSSYKIGAYAKILENGIPSDIGDITIGSHTMSADSLNEYQFQFPLAEGKALHGDSISVSLSAPNARTARTLATNKIVVPKEFYPASMSLPSLSIDRENSYTLNWQPDPNNQYGLVQIQLSYNPGLSQYYNSSLPSSIDDLVYRVADNGSYSIPSSDLSRFPKDAYVSISISRAWKLSSSGNIVYVAIVEAKTPPLLVVECPTNLSIDGLSSLCSSSTYSIPNLPVGSTVQWQASPQDIVNIDCPTCPQTTLTQVNNGSVILTATIIPPCLQVTTLSKQIIVGTPTTTCDQIGGLPCNQYNSLCPSEMDSWQQIALPGDWGITGNRFHVQVMGGGYFSNGLTEQDITSHYFDVYVPNNGNTITVLVWAANDCGPSNNSPYGITYFPNYGCYGGYYYAIAPNPVQSDMTVSLNKSKTNAEHASFDRVSVYDQQGNLKLTKKFGKTKTGSINVAHLSNGIYFVEISDGAYKEKQRLIIQK